MVEKRPNREEVIKEFTEIKEIAEGRIKAFSRITLEHPITKTEFSKIKIIKERLRRVV